MMIDYDETDFALHAELEASCDDDEFDATPAYPQDDQFHPFNGGDMSHD
jgi:hypothetical protein